MFEVGDKVVALADHCGLQKDVEYEVIKIFEQDKDTFCNVALNGMEVSGGFYLSRFKKIAVEDHADEIEKGKEYKIFTSCFKKKKEEENMPVDEKLQTLIDMIYADPTKVEKIDSLRYKYNNKVYWVATEEEKEGFNRDELKWIGQFGPFNVYK